MRLGRSEAGIQIGTGLVRTPTVRKWGIWDFRALEPDRQALVCFCLILISFHQGCLDRARLSTTGRQKSTGDVTSVAALLFPAPCSLRCAPFNSADLGQRPYRVRTDTPMRSEPGFSAVTNGETEA